MPCGWRLGAWLLAVCGHLLAGVGGTAVAATHMLLVEGLGGTRVYAEQFREEVQAMLPVLRSTAGENGLVRVLAGEQATSERVRGALGEIAESVAPGDALAVFLVGHGSHDGRAYKFNLTGPDFTGAQLKEWLDSVPVARQLVVSTTSSSGGMLATLKAPHRIVITATRNGRERTATVFGKFWAEAFSQSSADTDKSESLSALEVFRYAEDRVQAHYDDLKLLATEHPQLQGERADGFLLARLGEAAAMAEDPARRSLLARREEFEARIADLVASKETLPESEYLDALQALLLQLAELQQEIDGLAPGGGEEVP